MEKLRHAFATFCILFGVFWIVESHLFLPQISLLLGGWHFINNARGFSYSTEILLAVSLCAGFGVVLIAAGVQIFKKYSHRRTLAHAFLGILTVTALNFISYHSLPKADLLTYKMPMGNCGGLLSLIAQKTSNPLWVQAPRQLSNAGSQYLFKLQDETCAELRIGEVVAESDLGSCKKMGYDSSEKCMQGLTAARDEFYSSSALGRAFRLSNWASPILKENSPLKVAQSIMNLAISEFKNAVRDYSPFASQEEIHLQLKNDRFSEFKLGALFRLTFLPQLVLPFSNEKSEKVLIEYFHSASEAMLEKSLLDLVDTQSEEIKRQGHGRTLASEIELQKSPAQINFEAFSRQLQ